MIHRAKRVDANHATIVQAFRKCGAIVIDLSASGKGVMDILVSHRGRWLAVEIKDGAKFASQQALTPAQVKLHAEVAATGNEVHIVRCVDDALALLVNN